MCDVESYIYMPMLEELDYVPTRRYAYGEEIRDHLEAIAERFDLTDDALFHTGRHPRRVARGRGRAGGSTPTAATRSSCRWYVLAVGILNLMKLPAIAGMEDFAGARSTRRAGTTTTRAAGLTNRSTGLADKVVALLGTGATGIQCVPPLAESAKHVYVFQRTPSAIGERGNRPTEPDFADGLRAGLAAGPDGQLPGHHAGRRRGRRPGGRRVDAQLRRRQQPAASTRA